MMQSMRSKRLEKNKQTVSTLTLLLENEVKRTSSSPSGSDEWVSLKHLRYRQRQFSPWRSPSRHLQDGDTYLNMALSGKNYLSNSDATEVNSDEKSLKSGYGEVTGSLVHVPEIKDKLLLAIPNPPKRQDIEAISYFQNDFGFNMSKTDSFLSRKIPNRTAKKQELDEIMADQARRHIFACSNVGSVRKSCRSNESISRLKETMECYKERVQTTPSYNTNSSPIFQHAKPHGKLPSLHKTVGVFTRGELTRNSVSKKDRFDFPEITGISLL